MDIIMIRHGETDDNIKKIYGRKNTPLNKNGIRQIQKLEEIVFEYKNKKIYISPLERTMESAEILGLKGSLESRIEEIDFGIFEGRTYLEIQEDYHEETKDWIKDYMNYEIPQGESLKDVYSRIVSFIEEKIKKNEDIVLVTHEGVIRLLFSWVFEDPTCFFRFKVDNATINRITVNNGYKYISLLNYKA